MHRGRPSPSARVISRKEEAERIRREEVAAPPAPSQRGRRGGRRRENPPRPPEGALRNRRPRPTVGPTQCTWRVIAPFPPPKAPSVWWGGNRALPLPPSVWRVSGCALPLPFLCSDGSCDGGPRLPRVTGIALMAPVPKQMGVDVRAVARAPLLSYWEGWHVGGGPDMPQTTQSTVVNGG
jgi:hypothetical protein